MSYTTTTRRREYHFDRHDDMNEFSSTGTAPDWDANTEYGLKFELNSAAGSWAHFGDALRFNIDRLSSIEYDFRITAWDAVASAYLGVGSAFNADPTLIAAHAFVKAGGHASAPPVSVETDDGTNDLSVSANMTLPLNQRCVCKIDFRTGIQSVSVPSTSLGGKGSLQFTCTASNGSTRHMNQLSSHMDMSNYSGGLQPVFGIILSGSPGAACTMYVKSVIVEFEMPT